MQRAAGGRQTGSPRGRAARGGEGKRGGGVIASTSFTPTPAPRAGGHSARECQSPAGAPGNGRGRLRPRRLLAAWRSRGGAHAEALTPCGRRGAWGSPLRPVETSAPSGQRHEYVWVAGVVGGPERGHVGAVGPLVCSEAWAYVGTRSGGACEEDPPHLNQVCGREALHRCKLNGKKKSDQFSKQYEYLS